MTLLDRFRAQSRDKHPDAAVRLAYVAEIPLDDRATITAMAREDDDPRVRRAAVAKLMDPAALGVIAADDRDLDVRTQAAAMLRDIALEAFEGITENDSLEAVDAVGDARVLAQIAKSASREIVALRAVSRVSDAHILGSIARHAATESARRDAFAALASSGDRTELLAIAMNSEYKDTALAAVDRLSSHDELEQVASRSRNKSAAKRARAVLREAEEAEAREAAAREAAAREAADRAARDAAETAAREAADRAAREAADAEHAARAAAPAGPETADSGAAAHQVSAPATAPVLDELEAVGQREAAADAARRADEDRRLRLAELAGEAEAAAAQADLAAARKHMNFVRREWTRLIEQTAIDATLDEATARFTAADARVQARDAQARDADARARQEALARLQQLLARTEPLAARPDLTLKAADRGLRDVRAALGAMPALPSRDNFDELSRRLKAVQTALLPRVQELRDADDWRRFANVAVQEQLCAQMEALKSEEDAEVIARKVRELQQQWRQAADVPRAQADQLWRRFKTAHDEVWARCEAHFAAQSVERTANLEKKTALCERAEALADSTDWLKTADEIKGLQNQWKAIGPVSRGREKAIWERFRAACDRFFTRRHEDLAQRKTLWAANLAKKEALCVAAEGLADSTEWEATAAELRRLQAEWKTIGPVKKSRSEAIWQRFRGACDRFYARYAQRHEVARAERVAAREAICAEMEALEESDDLLAKVRALRSRWQQELAARGVDADRARELDARYAAAFAGVQARWPAAFAGTDMDPDANRKRMESIVTRIEGLAASLAGPLAAAEAPLSNADRLAAMLKEALAANTIGGRADDDARVRAALEDVRQAQASLARLGPVPDDTRRALENRFQRASRRISEKAAGTTARAGAASRS
jgi:hypothetical protein